MVCSWGRGEDGQLGHGDSEDRPVPTVLTSFDVPRITSVICGADHTTAYSDDEMQLYSWGWYAARRRLHVLDLFWSSSFVHDEAALRVLPAGETSGGWGMATPAMCSTRSRSWPCRG